MTIAQDLILMHMKNKYQSPPCTRDITDPRYS